MKRIIATILDTPIHLIDLLVCGPTRGGACPYRLSNGSPTRLRRILWWVQDHSAYWEGE